MLGSNFFKFKNQLDCVLEGLKGVLVQSEVEFKQKPVFESIFPIFDHTYPRLPDWLEILYRFPDSQIQKLS